VGGLLTAWWALPFRERFPYVTDMGYQRITTYMTTLFPTGDTWLFVLAGVGAALCIARRRRTGELFAVLAVLAVIAFRFMGQSILWNARVLPFWFLMLYLLGGLAVAELYVVMAERTTKYMVTLRAALLPGPLLVLVLALVWVGFPLRVLPGEHVVQGGNYEFLGIPQKSESYIPGWISWNYSGYEATASECSGGNCVKSRWPEYEQIVRELQRLSKTYGCGNVMWEYQSEMNNYGTPDALTILPYWTNGCIGSMEGLYYEASATTPFHFIDQSELSLQPSDPMNGLPYASSPDVALGVEHLQMLGVKYYMALNTELQKQAAADPSLQLVATLGPFDIDYSGSSTGPQGNQEQYWKFYRVLGSPRVHPLANQPVVMEGLNNSTQPTYLKVMTNWYDDPSAWSVYLAATGPSNWERVPYGDTKPPVQPEPPTTVSGIVEKNASISFDVSRLGVPVVVTVSYFPNWQVSGAEGVYRVSPNLMVVVPTSHHVRLWYGTTPVDYEGWALSLLALVGLVVLVRRPQARMAAVARPALGAGPSGRNGTTSRRPAAVEEPLPWAEGLEGLGGDSQASSRAPRHMMAKGPSEDAAAGEPRQGGGVPAPVAQEQPQPVSAPWAGTWRPEPWETDRWSPETGGPGEARSGEARSGEARSGEARSGEARHADAQSGAGTTARDEDADRLEPAQPGAGQPEAAQPGAAQPGLAGGQPGAPQVPGKDGPNGEN
jgi:hypothetical protein